MFTVSGLIINVISEYDRCGVNRGDSSAVSGGGRARAAQESTVVRTLRPRRPTPADRYESMLHQINHLHRIALTFAIYYVNVPLCA